MRIQEFQTEMALLTKQLSLVQRCGAIQDLDTSRHGYRFYQSCTVTISDQM